MTDERIDLRAIDPDGTTGAEARFVDAVMVRVGARPAAVRLPADPLVGIWSMMDNPALAAGIIIAIAAGAFGLRVHTQSQTAPATIAQAMGVPAEFLASARDGK